MDLMATMASRADPADLLARTPLFGGLDETSRKAVAMEMREAAYEPGQIIFSRGDAGSELHVVTKGRVRLSVLTSDGRELSFAHAEAPSIFGELAVFDAFTRACGRCHGCSLAGLRRRLVASAVAGGADGPAVPVELPPGGPLNMLTVNMITKATATAASVTRGLRCFTAPPPPDSYAYWR